MTQISTEDALDLSRRSRYTVGDLRRLFDFSKKEIEAGIRVAAAAGLTLSEVLYNVRRVARDPECVGRLSDPAVTFPEPAPPHPAQSDATGVDVAAAEQRWTPGPWEFWSASIWAAEGSEEWICFVHRDKMVDEVLADPELWRFNPGGDERNDEDANANLIAQAPRLYRELSDLVQWVRQNWVESSEFLDSSDEVLAAARGEAVDG